MSKPLSDKTVDEIWATIAFLGGGATEGSPFDRLRKDHLLARAQAYGSQCTFCHGTGVVLSVDQYPNPTRKQSEPCFVCEGSGRKSSEQPAGQVADDVSRIGDWAAHSEGCLAVPEYASRCPGCRVQFLARRLAEKAQAHDAAVEAMDEDGAESWEGPTLADRIRALSEDRQGEKARAERAENARDAAVANAAALLKVLQRVGGDLPSAGAALLATHRKEVEELKSVNAALLLHVMESASVSCEEAGPNDCGDCMSCHARTLIANPTNVGSELLTELNDHRRNIQVLRDELGAKDDEHVVTAFHRIAERANADELAAARLIKKLAECIRTRAGHEDNCRGWRKPVKGKNAPAWKRRGEWMDMERCNCGPGELLRLAAGGGR